MSAKLVKMSVLARMSGVPAATIKHYLNEGLIQATTRTSRNMAWYDPELADRIRAIKRLQKSRFLPLERIKQLLASGVDPTDEAATAAAITRVLDKNAGADSRTRAQLFDGGLAAEDLDWLEQHGLVHRGARGRYRGDDLTLLRVLGAARRAGLSREMLPMATLDAYQAKLRELVELELRMFFAGVAPRAGGQLAKLAEAATSLSEQLVVLLRRRLLLPTLARRLNKRR